MRRCTIVVVLSLLLSAGLLLLPVNAENNAGPDTSGSDLNIGAIAVGMLDNDMGVIMSPPRWQWTADRYMEEGQRCAAQCEYYKKKYTDTMVNLGPPLSLGGVNINDKIAEKASYAAADAKTWCNCAQQNYNKALQLTKKDNYAQQAEIFEAGTSLYDTLGMTKEAEQTRKAADVARAHAAAQIFLPLPAWIAVFAIVGGLILIHRKRE